MIKLAISSEKHKLQPCILLQFFMHNKWGNNPDFVAGMKQRRKNVFSIN